MQEREKSAFLNLDQYVTSFLIPMNFRVVVKRGLAACAACAACAA